MLFPSHTSLRRRWSSHSSFEPNHASKTCADEQRISKTIICLAPEPKPVGGGGWPERGRVHPQPAPCSFRTRRLRALSPCPAEPRPTDRCPVNEPRWTGCPHERKRVVKGKGSSRLVELVGAG